MKYNSINTLVIPKGILAVFEGKHIENLAGQFKRFFPKGDYPRKRDLAKWLHYRNQKDLDAVWELCQGANI